MGVGHTHQLVLLVPSTGVMGRPVVAGPVVKVVIRVRVDQARSVTIELEAGRRVVRALVRHISDHATTDTSGLPPDQTSGSVAAHDPVVDVRLDHELVPNLRPQFEVHGVVVGLAGGSLGREGDVAPGIPVRARSDGVASGAEVVVVGESVAEHQGPAATICVHVAVAPERLAAVLQGVHSGACPGILFENVVTELAVDLSC